jgi:hypothetical protein
MKSRYTSAQVFLVAIALLVVLALACTGTVTTPTGTVTAPKASSVISKVTMAEDVQGDKGDPVNPTTTFKPQATFHAVVAIENAPKDTQLKVAWYAVDVGEAASPNTEIDSYELSADGTRNIDFTLKPKTQWPVGKYRVEIYLNGNLDRTVEFSVK